MTRDEVYAVARGIRNAREGQHPNAQRVLDLAASLVADELNVAMGWTRNGNRRFQRERFLSACGVPDA